MSQPDVSDSDVLYVGDSPIRRKIIEYLSRQNRDWITISDLSVALGEQRGNVNFHCDKLKKNSLVDTQINNGKKYVRITEKAVLIYKEVELRNRRPSGKKLPRQDLQGAS